MVLDNLIDSNQLFQNPLLPAIIQSAVSSPHAGLSSNAHWYV